MSAKSHSPSAHQGAPPQVSPGELLGRSVAELAALPELRGEPAFRARQLAIWLYRRGASEAAAMTDLPGRLRERLAARYTIGRLAPVAEARARDASAVKLLLATRDGLRVEAVLLRTARRDTLCISSQIGCAYGCRFCATAAMGLARNLGRGEILAQVLALQAERARLGGEGLFNLVFMGMGEPLANYEELVGAIRILTDDHGVGIGRRRITVSTVGLPHAVRRLGREDPAVRLALSLNATENATRSQLMPINRRFPIEALLPAVADYRARTGQRVTFEYVLLAGVNDRRADAERLAAWARRYDCKVNLIRFNPHPLSRLRPTPPERVEAFRETMLPISPTVTLRESLGEEILAACGQLSTAYPPECGGGGGGGAGGAAGAPPAAPPAP